MAFCTKCGAQISDSAAFCTSCGQPTSNAEKNRREAMPEYQHLLHRLQRLLHRLMLSQRLMGLLAIIIVMNLL